MNETWKIMAKGTVNGLIAGVAGTLAMTVSEVLEERITGRPPSYIPAHVMERFLGLPTKPDKERKALNWAAHIGMGIAPAAWRGIMAEGGLRGPMSNLLYTAGRITFDETFENVSGVGKPPWEWPMGLATIDVMHKAVYAFTTGMVADRLATTPPPRAVREGGHAPA